MWEVLDENEGDIEFLPSKFRFPVLRKHEILTGVVEDKNVF